MTHKVETNFQKCVYQKSWKGDSSVDLGGGLILRIETSKRHSGDLVTTAIRGRKSDGGGFTYYPYSDFYKIYTKSDSRVTEKAVRLQHSEVLSRVEEVVKDCEDFYAKVSE